MLNETYELLSNFLLDLPQTQFNDGPTLDSVIVQSIPTSEKHTHTQTMGQMTM